MKALTKSEIKHLLPTIKGWEHLKGEIVRSFNFKDFFHTMAFVNAVAYVANQQDHHPDMEVGYNRCRVRFSTHSVKGISENDFACAAKVSALID
jgi:4a-hydroxytetrahydrobiopterin dehydratase